MTSLTPAKLDLLAWIGEQGILTIKQLTALSGRSDKAVGDDLRDLKELGYVTPFTVNPSDLLPHNKRKSEDALSGRGPNIYKVTLQGSRLLVSRDILTKEKIPKVPDYRPGSTLIGHEYGIRSVRAWLEVAARRYKHPGVKRWELPKEAIAPSLKPDALFRYALTDRDTFVGLVEVDRASERRPETWQGKFYNYTQLFTVQANRDLADRDRLRVIVTVPDDVRYKWLSAILKECVAGTPLETRRVFWIAKEEALEYGDWQSPIWHLPQIGGGRAFMPEGTGVGA